MKEKKKILGIISLVTVGFFALFLAGYGPSVKELKIKRNVKKLNNKIALDNKNWHIYKKEAGAAARIEVIPRLIQMFESGNPYERLSAALVLGELKETGPLFLITALAAWNDNLSNAAEKALKHITGQNFGRDQQKWLSWLKNQRNKKVVDKEKEKRWTGLRLIVKSKHFKQEIIENTEKVMKYANVLLIKPDAKIYDATLIIKTKEKIFGNYYINSGFHYTTHIKICMIFKKEKFKVKTESYFIISNIFRTSFKELFLSTVNTIFFSKLFEMTEKIFGDITPLIEALGDKDVNVRYAATDALVRIGKPAVQPLIRALKYKEWYVRKRAAYILGKIGDKRAIRPLIEALRDEDADVRYAATEALVRIGKPAVQPLIKALKYKEWYVRKRAAYILGKIGDKRAIKPLIEALRDEDADVRYAAAEALEKIDSQWGVTKAAKKQVLYFIEALKDKNANVRYIAAKALGKIGDKRAVKPLIKALRDEDANVRYAAAEALVRIGKPAVQPLIKALEYKEWYVRYTAAYALGKIGDKRTIKPFIKVHQDIWYSSQKDWLRWWAEPRKVKFSFLEWTLFF